MIRAHQRVVLSYGGIEIFNREVVGQLPVLLTDQCVFELAPTIIMVLGVQGRRDLRVSNFNFDI